MTVPVLEAFADAMMKYEGWFVGSRSYRNRNPGNLRRSAYTTLLDSEGYCVFQGLVAGYDALLQELWAKVSGRNEHGITLDSTIMNLFEVYAPVADGNNPRVYAGFVAKEVGLVYSAGVGPGTTFRQVYKFANQEPPESGQPAA